MDPALAGDGPGFSPDGRLVRPEAAADEQKLAWQFVHPRARRADSGSDAGDRLGRGLAWLDDPSASGGRSSRPLEHSGPVEAWLQPRRPDHRHRDARRLDPALAMRADGPWARPCRKVDPSTAWLFHPDGHLLAACGGTWRDTALEVPSGKPARHSGPPHARPDRGLQPDGWIIATAGRDGLVRLWSAATSPAHRVRPAARHGGHDRRVQPRRTHLARPAAEQGAVDGIRRPAARWAYPAHNDVVWTVGFSPDGIRFLTVAGTAFHDSAWSASGRRRRQPLFGPPLPQRVSVAAVAFHPDSQLIATGGWEGDVRIWDVATGRPVGPSLVHEGESSLTRTHAPPDIRVVELLAAEGECGREHQDHQCGIGQSSGAVHGDQGR